jgi:toxin YhaV
VSAAAAPAVVNGWTLFAHPLFLSQVDALATEVAALKRRDPDGYVRRNATKRLAAIERLALEIIPADPSRPEYRQGHTLGSAHAHWCRAKFFQQYRLFFRYHAPSRVIVYAWVNDEDSRRAYESQHDTYRTFRKMLERGHPPDGWDALLVESRAFKPPRR